MTEMTDKRVASLPKWARDELEDRRREIGALRDEVSHLRGQVKPGRIYYQVSMNAPVNIPEEARVFFCVGEMGNPRKGDEIVMNLDMSRKTVNVFSSFGGVGVLPQAENAVVLFPQSRSDLVGDKPWDGLMAGERKQKGETPARSQRCAKCDEMKDATENLGVVVGWICKDCRDAEKHDPGFPPALAGGDR
jgi:hypothetical protein